MRIARMRNWEPRKGREQGAAIFNRSGTPNVQRLAQNAERRPQDAQVGAPGRYEGFAGETPLYFLWLFRRSVVR
jgi:hypothetical protein